MKVFVSWSKSRSHEVALAIRDWLPTVIQECRDIFVSSEQEKGVAWFGNIAKNLDDAAVGLVIISPENQHEQWLNFEGGALLGRFSEERVCPVLLWMTPADYSGPLANLQMTRATDKSDVLKLLQKINALSTVPIDPQILAKAHDRAWPELESVLTTAEAGEGAVEPQRNDSDKLDEMLGILRDLRRGEAKTEKILNDAIWTSVRSARDSRSTLFAPRGSETPAAFITRLLAEQGDKPIADVPGDENDHGGARSSEDDV